VFFMILSYSLDVRHVPLHIIFFYFYVFVFKYYQFASNLITFDKNYSRGIV
jgi:hypothetical protein